MKTSHQTRFAALLMGVFAAIGVGFWQLGERAAQGQIQSATRESAASISSTLWAADFYTLRAREAMGVLASDSLPNLNAMSLSNGMAGDQRLELEQALADWISRYRYFNNVSLLSASGMELVRVDRTGSEVAIADAAALQDQRDTPGIREALRAPPNQAVRSEVALLTDSPYATIRGTRGTRVVLPLGRGETTEFLLATMLDAEPISEFLISEASRPPDHYLFVIRMDGVLAIGDELYGDYEFADQRGVTAGNAATLLPALWTAIGASGGNGEWLDDSGLYVFRTMIAPEHLPPLEPRAAAETEFALKSSVVVIFHPAAQLAVGNAFRGPGAWLAFAAIYAAVVVFALGFWRQQRQAEMLRAVSDAQSHALGVVKYELHTPAAAIDMMIDSGDHGPERWDQLAGASKHLLAIIDDLRLSISPDFGSQGTNTRISFRQLTHEVDRQMDPLLAERGQALRYTLPEWADDLYIGQYFMVRVIITNLLRYAATQSTGRQIWLSYGRESLSGNRDRIEVAIDTDGNPLSPEEAQRLFLPFGDVGRLGPIAGISLHMIQHWMEELGGEITATSSSRGGIHFGVRLPLPRSDAGSLEEAEARYQTGAHHALSGHTILLVEDDQLLGPLVEEVLQRQFGLAVTRCNSGDSALEHLQTHRFDMMLIDYYMPGMDGLTLIREVRKTDAAVPIIGMSGGENEYTRQQLQQAGADYVLVKPVTRTRFDAAMASLESAGRLKFQQKFPT